MDQLKLDFIELNLVMVRCGKATGQNKIKKNLQEWRPQPLLLVLVLVVCVHNYYSHLLVLRIFSYSNTSTKWIYWIYSGNQPCSQHYRWAQPYLSLALNHL